MQISDMHTRPQLMLKDKINFRTSKYTFHISKFQTRANLGNPGENKKHGITAVDAENKVTGDGLIPKENGNATENKIKGNTHIYINKA